jgi:hypothetical protein
MIVTKNLPAQPAFVTGAALLGRSPAHSTPPAWLQQKRSVNSTGAENAGLRMRR